MLKGPPDRPFTMTGCAEFAWENSSQLNSKGTLDKMIEGKLMFCPKTISPELRKTQATMNSNFTFFSRAI